MKERKGELLMTTTTKNPEHVLHLSNKEERDNAGSKINEILETRSESRL